MEEMILHSDLNCFYASVEINENPRLRGQKIAVCGSTENHHGIVLTASYALPQMWPTSQPLSAGHAVRHDMSQMWIGAEGQGRWQCGHGDAIEFKRTNQSRHGLLSQMKQNRSTKRIQRLALNLTTHHHERNADM